MGIYNPLMEAVREIRATGREERQAKRQHAAQMQNLQLKRAEFEANLPILKQKIDEAKYWNEDVHFGLENALPTQNITPDKYKHAYTPAKDGKILADEISKTFLLGTPQGTYMGEDFKPYNADGTPYTMSRREYSRRFGGAASVIAARTSPVAGARTRSNELADGIEMLDNDINNLLAETGPKGNSMSPNGILIPAKGGDPINVPEEVARLKSQKAKLVNAKKEIDDNLISSEWREQAYRKKAEVFTNLKLQTDALGVSPHVMNYWDDAIRDASARADYEKQQRVAADKTAKIYHQVTDEGIIHKRYTKNEIKDGLPVAEKFNPGKFSPTRSTAATKTDDRFKEWRSRKEDVQRQNIIEAFTKEHSKAPSEREVTARLNTWSKRNANRDKFRQDQKKRSSYTEIHLSKEIDKRRAAMSAGEVEMPEWMQRAQEVGTDIWAIIEDSIIELSDSDGIPLSDARKQIFREMRDGNTDRLFKKSEDLIETLNTNYSDAEDWQELEVKDAQGNPTDPLGRVFIKINGQWIEKTKSIEAYKEDKKIERVHEAAGQSLKDLYSNGPMF